MCLSDAVAWRTVNVDFFKNCYERNTDLLRLMSVITFKKKHTFFFIRYKLLLTVPAIGYPTARESHRDMGVFSRIGS